jgi:hypothetical protein
MPRKYSGAVQVELYSCFKLGIRCGGQHHTLATLTPGMTWYPFYMKMGGHQD